MKKLFVILVMLVAMNASAQWVQMSNGMGTDKRVNCFTSLGSNLFAGTDSYGVYLSTNNGDIWVQTSLNNKTIMSLAASGNNIIAGTVADGIYYSINNGTTWTQTSINNLDVLSLAVSGNNVFAGIWYDGLYLSTNNGINWNQLSLVNYSVKSIVISGTNIFAGTGLHGVYISTNSGNTWSQTSLQDGNIWSLASVDNKIIAATANPNNIFLSSNSGVNWVQKVWNNQYIYSSIVSNSSVFLATSNGIYQSTNYGDNWIQKNQGFSFNPLVRSIFISNNFVYSGTDPNSVWRRTLSEITGIQNISTETPSKYSLSQNYPNPFNSMCNVQFSMCNAGNVKLVVYDIQGREVQTLVNERLQPGTYEAAFDGSMLNSGVYFYKLIIRHGESSTIGFTETKKMLLIK